ncbi:metal-dependent hydrolase [Janthinobacterium fluminis]|uniref:Metal-dependent hydrolase n=1 Tax=Janthinobacterium fluminis TaxID=2987524 RepID=A0ABT5K637_9BURK|nr:metal-dependent hydrolase [Janthinobacterium fluminis]MDC8760364.1 metal-dependent hydrolase [Janthinobacterium fluminis]
MASNKAHHATGWAAGVIAAALVAHAGAGGPYQIVSFLSFVAGVLGGTAPDWLELAWWSRRRRLWITHRTWTHWGIAWLGLLAYAYLALPSQFWAAPLFGFACGGVMHLLADWPNPLGVPWIAGRHSLKLWKSGRCDLIVVTAAWLTAGLVADHVFFQNVHAHKALAFVRALPACS